jgi:AraC-like DNA-binding protein
MNNSITFFLPSPSLREFIRNYYIIEFYTIPDTESFEQRHLSDGCIEMFIGYQDTRSTCYGGDGKAIFLDSGVVGARNLASPAKGLLDDTGSKTFKFVSINFRQNGFYNIFKIPGSETYNGFFDGSTIIGEDIERLRQRLSDANTNTERISYLENYLKEKYAQNLSKSYRLCGGMEIASFISGKKGNVRFKELMSEFNASERTIERNFKTATGYSVKEYCKILRFSNLLGHITYNQNIVWADMVSMCGYYDQSHLINEFKSATGIAPAVYCKNINKNVFRIYNHLAILNSKELTGAMIDGSINSLEVLSEDPELYP